MVGEEKQEHRSQSGQKEGEDVDCGGAFLILLLRCLGVRHERRKKVLVSFLKSISGPTDKIGNARHIGQSLLLQDRSPLREICLKFS
ncbi:MAG: hypothetical protein FJ403_19605 [Verrucomicrobia bacterium]|nr:hypothetical protein [Verrucomicrobiota bacterium]